METGTLCLDSLSLASDVSDLLPTHANKGTAEGGVLFQPINAVVSRGSLPVERGVNQLTYHHVDTS